MRRLLALAGAIVLTVAPSGFGTTAEVLAAEEPPCQTIHVSDDPAVVDEIQLAIDGACPGAHILIGPGDYQGAEITKTVHLEGSGDATRIVSGTPAFWDYVAFFIDAGGDADGTSIRSLAIVNDPDAWFPAGVLARVANDITIDGLTITNTAQGITNASGDRWTITHNRIYGFAAPFADDHLVGIGIWSESARYGAEIGAASDNLVAGNEIVVDYAGEHQELLIGIDVGTWPAEWPAPVEYNLVTLNTIQVSGNADVVLGVNLFDLGTQVYGFPTVVRGNVIEGNLICAPNGPKARALPGGLRAYNVIRGNECDLE